MTAAISFLLASAVCAAPPQVATQPDTAVVCPRAFHTALAPWIEHRRQQGHEIVLLSSQGSSNEIRARIRACAEAGSLKNLLLVGDARSVDDAADAPRTAARLVAASINVRFGSESTIASDNWYADLDDDRIPDIAVGRLTCDNALEMSELVNKIIRYETNLDFGDWRRRIRFVAGVGGFDPVTDALVEATARQLICHGLPAGYSCELTSANWQSPYCPPPPLFARVVHEGLNQGSLFWVYMGHGHRQQLDVLRTPDRLHSIIDTTQIKHLQCGDGSPIAILLACYVGAFDGPRDSLAEEMLRAKEGPVAVLAGSRVTMPYGMAVFASALADAYVAGKSQTIGQLLLSAKRQTAGVGGAKRTMLNFLARVASPNSDELAEERMEHIAMFNLLGDPLLRLRYPLDVSLKKLDPAAPGDTIVVHGTSPVSGRATIELVSPRGQPRTTIARRETYAVDDASLRQMQSDYADANEVRYATTSLDVAAGEFTARLLVPSDASGLCDVRIFVQGPNAFALGSTNVSVRRPRADDSLEREPE